MVLEKIFESPLENKEIRPTLKEVHPEYSLERLMLKLKLRYFGRLTQRVDSLEKTLMLKKIEGKWRRGWQRMRLLDSITNSMDMNLGELQDTGVCKGQGGLAFCSQWGHKESDNMPLFIRRTDAESEASMLWPPDAKN